MGLRRIRRTARRDLRRRVRRLTTGQCQSARPAVPIVWAAEPRLSGRYEARSLVAREHGAGGLGFHRVRNLGRPRGCPITDSFGTNRAPRSVSFHPTRAFFQCCATISVNEYRISLLEGAISRRPSGGHLAIRESLGGGRRHARANTKLPRRDFGQTFRPFIAILRRYPRDGRPEAGRALAARRGREGPSARACSRGDGEPRKVALLLRTRSDWRRAMLVR